ncbi:MAG: hypothetical protein KKH94_12410 [Candidatus Omnitrophica bacterium]|nr:hypothetical protein [bacterium]MBU1864455.1 hypothetical protein [Candidatus Omnitrophota bacterium]
MKNITDELGREFIETKACADVVKKSLRQLYRDIRNMSIVTIKRGMKSYVLIEDVAKKYHMSKDVFDVVASEFNDKTINITGQEEEADISEVAAEEGTERQNMGDIKEDDIPGMDLVTRDLIKTTKGYMSALDGKLEKIEKGIHDLHSVERDWQNIDRKLDYQRRLIKKIGQGRGTWIWLAVSIIILLAAGVAFYYAFIAVDTFIKNRELKEQAQSVKVSQMLQEKEDVIKNLVSQHDNTTAQYSAIINSYQASAEEYKTHLMTLQKEYEKEKTEKARLEELTAGLQGAETAGERGAPDKSTE